MAKIEAHNRSRGGDAVRNKDGETSAARKQDG